MTKLSELQKAVANRNFEHDAIDEDLEFVEDQFDAFRKYFNAVYEDVCAGETAKVFLSSGRWTTEQYQDKIVSLDQSRRMAHDRAVDACKILNRMCDMQRQALSGPGLKATVLLRDLRALLQRSMLKSQESTIAKQRMQHIKKMLHRLVI